MAVKLPALFANTALAPVRQARVVFSNQEREHYPRALGMIGADNLSASLHQAVLAVAQHTQTPIEMVQRQVSFGGVLAPHIQAVGTALARIVEVTEENESEGAQMLQALAGYLANAAIDYWIPVGGLAVKVIAPFIKNARLREPVAALLNALGAYEQAVVTASSALVGYPPRHPAVGRPGTRGRAAVVVVVLVLLGAGAMGIWLAQGSWSERGTAIKPTTSTSAPTPASSPLQHLAGRWTDQSGVVLEAMVVDDLLELRVVKPEQVARYGYAANEPRLTLRPKEGENSVYLVDDHARPRLPPGTTYADDGARAACLAHRQEVDGQLLTAHLEADQLTVEQVTLLLAPSALRRRGNQIATCTGLADARVVRKKVVYRRGEHPPKPPSASGARPRQPVGKKQSRQACIRSCIASCNDDAGCERICVTSKCK